MTRPQALSDRLAGWTRRCAMALVVLVACDPSVTSVVEVPIIAMSNREVRLASTSANETPATDTVIFSNNGAGSLEGLVVRDPVYSDNGSDWLTRVALIDTVLHLEASGDSLETDTYTATLQVELANASNSPRTLTVNLEVRESQRLELSADTLRFSARDSLPEPQVVTVSNGGAGTLDLDSVTVDQSWLDDSLSSTVAPAKVTLVPNTLLPAGQHTATVTVWSRLSTPESKTVGVTFEVDDQSDLQLSTNTVVFNVVEGSTADVVQTVQVTERNRRVLQNLAVSASNATWLNESLDTSVDPPLLTLTANPSGLAPGSVGDMVQVSSANAGFEMISFGLNVEQGPAMLLAPDSVQFNAIINQAVPALQEVLISNDSSGTLGDITFGPVPSWLVLPKLTADTTRLILQVATTALAAGTLSTNVVVQPANAPPRNIPVVYSLLPAPSMSVSADSITFRGEAGTAAPSEQRIAIRNQGGGPLHSLSVSGVPTWLDDSLTSAVAPAELVLQPITLGLAPEIHVATLDLAGSSGTSGQLTVVFDFAAAGTPIIAPSPTRVDFVGAEREAIAPQVIVVENGADGTLQNLAAVSTQPWLTPVVDSTTTPPTVTLGVDATNLALTIHTGVVNLSATGAAPVAVPVSFTLQAGPSIALSANRVTFRGRTNQTPAPQTLIVANSGAGTLDDLRISSDSTWVTPSLSDTVAPTELRLNVDPTGLSPGTHSAIITVFSPAKSTPATVTVVYELGGTSPPDLVASPANVMLTLSGSDTDVTQLITLENAGRGDPIDNLVATQQGGPTWFTIAGPSPDSTPATLTIQIDPFGRPDTAFTEDILVTGAGGVSRIIQVDVVIDNAPTIPASLALSEGNLQFFGVSGDTPPPPAAQQITVYNDGGGTVDNITVTGVSTWLTVNPPSGPAPGPLSIQPNTTTSGVVIGPQSVTLQVNSDAGSSALVVTYDIDPPPSSATSPATVDFMLAKSDPVIPQTVRIDNTGGGRIRQLNVTSQPPWITNLILAGQNAPTTLTFEPDTSGPASPTRSGTVELSSSTGPISIPVTLTLQPAPALALTANAIGISSGVDQPLPPAQTITIANASTGRLDGIRIAGIPTWLDTILSDTTAPASLQLQLNTTSGIPRADNATLTISSSVPSIPSTDLTVSYQLDPPATTVLSPDRVQFTATERDAAPAPRQIAMVENDSSGTLNGLQALFTPPLPAWLSATVPDPTAPTTVILSVNPAAVQPGTFQTTVDISSPVASTVSIPVQLDLLPGPIISPSVDGVTFRGLEGDGQLPQQAVTVANGGFGTLSGLTLGQTVYSGTPGWLMASLLGSAGPTSIALTADVSGLSTDTLVATVPIQSLVAPTVDLTVTLEVHEGGMVAVSAAAILMTGIADSVIADTQQVSITNVGGGTLTNLGISGMPTWLSAEFTNSEAPSELRLAASGLGLAAEVLQATLTIGAAGAPDSVDVEVTFDVAQPTALSPSPSHIRFNSLSDATTLPDTQLVSLINTGSGTLQNITFSPPVNWLSVELDATTTPATLRVSPREVLDAANSPHTTTITVTSPSATNSPRSVQVTYDIELPSGPVIVLSETELTFDRDNPPAQTLRITNGGSGTLRDLRVEDVTDVDWLFVLLDGRVAPATLTVAVNANNAANAAPNSVATLQVLAEGADPQIITVRLP